MHRLLRYFEYEHLATSPLKSTSFVFAELAHHLDAILPDGDQKDVALQKLLESKDAGVRAILPEDE